MKKNSTGRRLHALAKRTLCVLVIAALLLAVSGCGSKGDGDDKQAEGVGQVTGVAGELVGDSLGHVVETVGKLAEQGLDVTISAELTDGYYQGKDINELLKGTQFNLKMAGAGDRMGVESTLTVQNRQFFSGKVIYDNAKGELGIYLPEMDNTYYTIDLTQFSEYREYMETLERLSEVKFSEKDLMDTLDRYVDIIVGAVNDASLASEEDGSFSFKKLDGGSQEGTVYTIKPTAENMTALFERLADEVEGDKTIQDLIVQIAVATDPYGRDESYFREELDEAMKDMGDELREAGEDMADALEEIDFETVIYTGKDGWRTEINFEDYGGTNHIYIEKNNSGFAVWAENDYQTYFEAVAKYQKSGSNYTGDITLKVEEQKVATLSFEKVNTGKTSVLGIPHGNYTLAIPDVGEFYLDVTASGTGTDHVFSMNVPELEQECRESNMPNFASIKLTVHTTDQKVTVSTPSGHTVALNSFYELEDVFNELGYRLAQRADEMGLMSLLQSYA